MAELYVRHKIEVGLRQLDEGQGIPQEEVEKKLERWLK
jgi:predicted transcriptional regulator